MHPCNEELRILDSVGDFLKAFEGLKKYITTNMPLPLVQMSKTFLFVWIFTLPFVLCHDNYTHGPSILLLIVFLITFGFMGLEFVAMELSDCFGDDPSDLDNGGYAELCFEDCYVAIYKVDGEEWARRLRQMVLGRSVPDEVPRDVLHIDEEADNTDEFATPEASFSDLHFV